MSQAPSNLLLFSSSVSTLSVGGSKGTLKQSNLLLSLISWISSVTRVDSVQTASELTYISDIMKIYKIYLRNE